MLAVVAAVMFISLWNEGRIAQQKAQTILNASDFAPETSVLPEQIKATAENSTPPIPISTLTLELNGFTIIARIDVDKIGVHLPILAETTDAALKVSACYYTGVMPGEDGNMVVTGHNYASGAIFGKLDQLETGNIVMLTGMDGTTSAYTVYKIDHTKPDSVDSLNEMEYLRELTLLTCESHGNGRLIVRCRSNS
jgi:LPXTG-site transpeptidase (sortase) family protein